MNKGILYTTYYSKLKNVLLSTEGKLFRISRTVPYRVDFDRCLENLYPPNLLFEYYKGGRIDWDIYSSRYIEYILQNGKNDLNLIAEELDKSNNVILCCYEKDPTHCHRSCIGAILKASGYEVREYV